MPSLTHHLILDRISLRLAADIVVRIMTDALTEVDVPQQVLRSTTQAVQMDHTGKLTKGIGNDLKDQRDQRDLLMVDETVKTNHVHHR